VGGGGGGPPCGISISQLNRGSDRGSQYLHKTQIDNCATRRPTSSELHLSSSKPRKHGQRLHMRVGLRTVKFRCRHRAPGNAPRRRTCTPGRLPVATRPGCWPALGRCWCVAEKEEHVDEGGPDAQQARFLPPRWWGRRAAVVAHVVKVSMSLISLVYLVLTSQFWS
jgi:hypothetical protein